MDVDLLRPGTVPISKDTVMWFEFLLNPIILKKHLSKSKPDPSPIDLIIKFSIISSDLANGSKQLDPNEIVVTDVNCDTEKIKDENFSLKTISLNRRSLGLKILALKVASFIGWDLDALESKLPLSIQSMLIMDLLKFTRESLADISTHNSLDFNNEPGEVLFAVSLYHRWVLKSIVNNSLAIKSRPGIMETNVGLIGDNEILNKLEEQVDKSGNIVNNITKLLEKKIDGFSTIPSYDTFVPVTEDGDIEKPKWDLGVKIKNSEFLCLVLIDLSSYLFFREDYEFVKNNAERCKKEIINEQSSKFHDTIRGYLQACQRPLQSSSLNLIDRFHVSVREHYVGILSILMEDNLKREIPIYDRESLELDIAAALSSGIFTATRDLLFQIQTLNAVLKKAIGCLCFYDYSEKLNNSRRSVEIFVWALQPMISDKRPEEKERLRNFVIEVIESSEPSIAQEMAKTDLVQNLLTQHQLVESLSLNSKTVILPAALVDRYNLPDFTNMKLISADLEKQLLSAEDPQSIRELIIKLVENNSIRPVHQINCKWELGVHLHSYISNMANGVLQHLLYVLLGKAKHLDSIGKFDGARKLLVAAEQETLHHGNSLLKLAHLISLEALLVDIHQLNSEWPMKPTGWQSIIPRCTSVLQINDSIVCPRKEILEQAAITLLNVGEWDAISSLPLDKRVIFLDLVSSMSFVCQEMVKFKGGKKVSRDLWDLIVPAFVISNAQKRNQSSIHQDSSSINQTVVIRFLSSLRDHVALTCAISLLVKLLNVLRDEVNQELIAEHTAVWPGVVSSANSYNTSLVSEVLLQLIHQTIDYYPRHIPLFKLLGDHHFVSNHYSGALKYYLIAAIIASDNFHRPLTKLMIEDYVYKRMIKCLALLQCHTQAGILCQFLEEIDYNCAFKSLSEVICHDSMDTYYDCIWDVNVLEYLIWLHTKKGNRDRAKKAIDTIGLLELNCNNNEEIKREATNKRKTRFMQALSRQFVF